MKEQLDRRDNSDSCTFNFGGLKKIPCAKTVITMFVVSGLIILYCCVPDSPFVHLNLCPIWI